MVVTNDFPPRPGGIQAFAGRMVDGLAAALPAGSVLVLASRHPGDAAYDAGQPYQVVRYPHYPMVPTPGVARLAATLARQHRAHAVWFAAAAPLGLLGPAVRRAGVRRVVVTSHGHEAGWARLPGGRLALRRIAASADVFTYLGDYTRRRIEPVVGGRTTLARLAPGVDDTAFSPSADGAVVRRRYGLGDAPVIVCVSRLVPRKGQDTLIRALPSVAQRVPGVRLLVVSGGPDGPRLRRLADRCGVTSRVVFTGEVPWAELPAHFAAGDVFAMPCRTRRGGLDVEGLGIVYLEASATGMPVVAGTSGGAPDAVLDGVTGRVVDGRDASCVADVLAGLLTDRAAATRMGEAGRSWIGQAWRWDAAVQRLLGWLQDGPHAAD